MREGQRGTSPAGFIGCGSFGVGEGRGGVEDCGSGRSLRGGGLPAPLGAGGGTDVASVAAGGADCGRLRRRASASPRCSLRGASWTSRCRAFRSLRGTFTSV